MPHCLGAACFSESRVAWCWIPLGSVAFELVVDGRLKRRLQVHRILDDICVHEVLVAVRERMDVPMLGEKRALAIRPSVLARVPGGESARDRLQGAEARGAASAAAPHDPLRRGVALPTAWTGSRG